MGCDIHGFVEYSTQTTGLFDIFAERIWLDRDYRLFSALAGVRSDAGFSPRFPPRGLPERLSQWGFLMAHSPVADLDSNDATYARGFGSFVIPAEVGDCDIISSDHPSSPFRFKIGYILDGGAHSHSWLTVDEIRLALAHAELLIESTPVDFQAIINAMQTLELKSPACVSRLVFWFDN
jgi:hypothetical protein